MADNQFNLSVGAILDASNIPQQLQELNSQLSKSDSTKIKFRLDTGQLITAVKEVNQFNSAVGKIKQVRIYDPQSGAQFKNDLVKINEGLQIVNTETNKWTNNLGQLVTQVKTTDNAGNELITETTKYVNALHQEVEEVRLLDGNLNQLGNTTSKVSNITREMTNTTSSKFGVVTDTVDNVTKAYRGLITTTEKVGSNGEYLRTVVSKYTNQLGQTIVKTEQFDKANNQVATTQRVVSDEIQKTNSDVKTLGMSLGDAFKRLSNFYLASLPIKAVQTAITNAVETVKEFDSALIEFRKVSDLAGESLTRYVAKLAEMGEITGSTMQAMVEASTEFRKSGFTDEDSAKLASVAEMYRNIADEEISAGESASFIIAQMKAFNIEADQAEHIIDGVNEVANNFSVSSADLAKNLGNMSAIMAINNVSMEEQIGMLTGVTEITRNASSASRGLVMISSRLTQVLDDTSSTGKKLTKIYGDLGIALKDESGQLRSHYDILGDLALKWNDLSENEQKYIALTSAGARQQQNFVSLMENWGQVAKATSTAYNSLGSAQKENEKVMDSVAKKVEVLKSQFQQLVIGKGGLQSFAKTILDVGIAILKFANSDIGKLIIKTTAWVAITTLVIKGLNSLKTSLLEAGRAIVTAYLEMNGLTAATIAQKVAQMGLLTALKAVTAGFLNLAAAMLTNPITWIGIGIAALVVAIVASVKALDDYNKRLDTAKENLNNLAEEANNAETELDSLKSALENVREQIKINNQQKLEITDEDELERLRKETDELKEQEKSLERQIILQQQKLDIAKQEASKAAQDTLHTTTTSQFKGTWDKTDYANYWGSEVTPENELRFAIDRYKELRAEKTSLEQITEHEISLNNTNSETYKNAANRLTEIEAEMKNVSDRGIEMKEIILTAADSIVVTDDTSKNLKDTLYSLADTFDNIIGYEKELNDQQQVTEEETEEEAEAIDELSKHVQELAQSLGITQTELAGLREKFDDLTLDKFLSQLAEVRQEISDTNTVIDNLQGALEAATQAQEEYNENGYLTIDTFQSLVGISAQYLASLVNENGQLEINQTTLGNLVDTLKMAKIEELAEAAATEIAALQHQESATTADAAQRAVDAAGDAFTRAGDKASKASAGVALFNAELSKATGGTLGDFTGSEKVIIDKYRNLAKQISTLSVNTTAAGNAAKSAGKKGAGAAKEAKDATKELNKELEETKKKYDTVIKWISKQYDKKVDSIKKAKDAATDAIEKEIKALEKEKDTVLDSIEKETNALEKEKDARKKYWDDQIDALKKANNARKDALELQEKLDALEKARNTKVKIYKEGQGFVYDVDQTKVAEAQKALDDYLSEKAYEDELERLEALRDAEMDNYEKRIDALNDYKDKVQKSYEEQIDALNAHREALEAQYDAEIETYQNYKQQFEDMVNAYQEQQDKLLAEQLLGIKLEGDNWMTRLDNLAEFVRKYNELQKQLDTGNTSVSNNASMKSGSGGGGSSKTTTTTTGSYDREMTLSHQGYHGMPTNVVTGTRATSGLNQYIPTTEKTNVSSNGVIRKVSTHANGIGSIKDNELAIVGENPNQEIVIGSKLNNGELMSLDKGSGVVNAESSSTLAGMLNQVGKFGSSGFGSGNGTLNSNINNDTLTINGVTIQGANIKDPETFVNGLLNLKAEALQRAYKHR